MMYYRGEASLLGAHEIIKQAVSMGVAFTVVLVLITPNKPVWLEVLAWVALVTALVFATATINAPKISTWCDNQLKKGLNRKKDDPH
ncbi:hypothetical protein [Vibrio breoganii]|uniref:hypothetical protein n=1 Tax=Vibrio breoganii TaxID=553239 RepID=UPI000C8367C0|nr:hypothetical protein [Vibrio breoganii]PMG94269.1 hypothetical protein BCU79_12345 [Vibrio breoganii]PMI16073.1 hypothetical protein BCU49_01875 [Vibrio breoganii]PMJ46086.1 hypothetical protein BCU21_11915 [Vibrio breoganii]PMK55028.1 hypothetical protein BCT97_00615 [Vibrio breoganii]PMM89703.1 hypothetical protein BCT44_16720 [Vibrio breoganii]